MPGGRSCPPVHSGSVRASPRLAAQRVRKMKACVHTHVRGSCVGGSPKPDVTQMYVHEGKAGGGVSTPRTTAQQ